MLHNNSLRDLQSVLDHLVHHRHLKQLSIHLPLCLSISFLSVLFSSSSLQSSFLLPLPRYPFSLFQTDLLGNPCAEEERYREIVLSRLPLLEIFDRHGTSSLHSSASTHSRLCPFLSFSLLLLWLSHVIYSSCNREGTYYCWPNSEDSPSAI